MQDVKKAKIDKRSEIKGLLLALDALNSLRESVKDDFMEATDAEAEHIVNARYHVMEALTELRKLGAQVER